MHIKNIEKIIEGGNVEQMRCLKDLMVSMMDGIKSEDKHKYVHYEYKIHKILYGCHLGKDLATYWVSNMENKDGSHGGHWTYEQTSQVMRDKGIKCDESDFYAVLNMMYSDYFDSKFDTSTYVMLAKDWLEDDDVPKGKTVHYYYFVVCA